MSWGEMADQAQMGTLIAVAIKLGGATEKVC
jgi:hypothetical protein